MRDLIVELCYLEIFGSSEQQLMLSYGATTPITDSKAVRLDFCRAAIA